MESKARLALDLDGVEGLGDFLEFEFVLREGEPAGEGTTAVYSYPQALGIGVRPNRLTGFVGGLEMKPMTPDEVQGRMPLLPAWSAEPEFRELRREFRFGNYHETMAFVNAVAWIAHRSDHHPDLEVGYNRCVVRFSTHDAGGLTERDFESALKVSALGSDLTG